MSLRNRIFVGITVNALFVCAGAHADEYSVKYGVSADYEYNDNVRLTPDDKSSISGGQVALPVSFASRSERLTSSLDGTLEFSQYDDSGYDSDDQNLQGKIKYLLERGEVEGYAGYKRDSTRSYEFDDTGLVGASATRVERLDLGGSGSTFFTQRNGITGGIDYGQVDYQSPRLQDYRFTSGYGGWINQWNERTRLRLQGYFSRYDNDDGPINVESDTFGLQVGFDSDWSERLSASLLAGWAKVETNYDSQQTPPPDDDSTGLLLEGRLTFREERYEVEAKVINEPQPTGSGTLYARSRLDLSYLYQVSERSNFDLALILGQQSAVESAINNDRDFARIRLKLDYRITGDWYVAGTYQYSYQDREQESGDASSNAVYLSLIYQPEKQFIWSR